MEQIVQVVQYQSDIKYVPLEDQFKLCTERGHVWLQRMAIWVLRRLGCNAITIRVEATRVTVNTDHFMSNLIAQDRELVSMYHQRGDRLLLGNEEFHKLVNCDILNNHPISFEAAYRHTVREGNEYSIGGFKMKVTVIPWMKGMLVLPKGWDR
jgi:hypothetical protein